MFNLPILDIGYDMYISIDYCHNHVCDGMFVFWWVVEDFRIFSLLSYRHEWVLDLGLSCHTRFLHSRRLRSVIVVCCCPRALCNRGRACAGLSQEVCVYSGICACLHLSVCMFSHVQGAEPWWKCECICMCRHVRVCVCVCVCVRERIMVCAWECVHVFGCVLGVCQWGCVRVHACVSVSVCSLCGPVPVSQLVCYSSLQGDSPPQKRLHAHVTLNWLHVAWCTRGNVCQLVWLPQAIQ